VGRPKGSLNKSTLEKQINELSVISDNPIELKEKANHIREIIGDVWYTVGYKALDELQKRDFAEASNKDLTTMADKATENARLLEGKPTEIVAQYKLVIEKYIIKKPDEIEIKEIQGGDHE